MTALKDVRHKPYRCTSVGLFFNLRRKLQWSSRMKALNDAQHKLIQPYSATVQLQMGQYNSTATHTHVMLM